MAVNASPGLSFVAMSNVEGERLIAEAAAGETEARLLLDRLLRWDTLSHPSDSKWWEDLTDAVVYLLRAHIEAERRRRE